MAKFQFTELTEYTKQITARLGAGTGSANWLTDAEVGKLVKLVGDSRYDLCAVGNEIEGRITAIDGGGSYDNFTLGTVQTDCRMEVIFDGIQATPGTGTLAIGDYVVCGTPVAKGTALVFPATAKVCKATAAATGIVHKWRVVSLGSAGTGAVGTAGLIEKVGA